PPIPRARLKSEPDRGATTKAGKRPPPASRWPCSFVSSGERHRVRSASDLTTDTESQAQERTGSGRDNKGWEAAAAGIEMAVLFRQLGRAIPRAFGVEPGGARGES